MSKMVLFHGSDHVIKVPSLKQGKLTNDYGQGFYCTVSLQMAKEWACKGNDDGFVNSYTFDTNNLKILNLLDGKHSVLNWIALLLKNRIFTIKDQISKNIRNYVIEHFAIDTSEYDVIIGYRADDSYFSYAQAFINNTLPLRSLSSALELGKLGEQVVLVSDKAFNRLSFIDAEFVEKESYYPKFKSRDEKARKSFNDEIKVDISFFDDIFAIDIIREGISNDDPRIQRIILE